MALEELWFEGVNGQADGQRSEKVITIAHPEHGSSELKTCLRKI